MHIHFHYFLSKRLGLLFPCFYTVMLLPKSDLFVVVENKLQYEVSWTTSCLYTKLLVFCSSNLMHKIHFVECWFPLNLNFVCLKCIWWFGNQAFFFPCCFHLMLSSIKCDIHACFSTHHNSVSSSICDLSCVNELWKVKEGGWSDDIFRTAWGHSFPYVLSLLCQRLLKTKYKGFWRH